MRLQLWDPAIESLGLTRDTPLGPVDLVAVDRARSGHPVELTEAELTWLALEMGKAERSEHRDPVRRDARLRAAEALGITTESLSDRLVRRINREQRRAA